MKLKIAIGWGLCGALLACANRGIVSASHAGDGPEKRAQGAMPAPAPTVGDDQSQQTAQRATARSASGLSVGVRGGVYIRVPEARQVTFRHASVRPAALLHAVLLDEAGNTIEGYPILKTVGAVTLDTGLRIGQVCAEHLRLGDTVVRGVVQNAGPDTVELSLSDGVVVSLGSEEAIYVDDRLPKDGEPQPIATHHWECQCACTVEGGSGSVTYNCKNCGDEGNQCKASDGSACIIDIDGEGPIQPQEGTLSDCREILVPNPPEP